MRDEPESDAYESRLVSLNTTGGNNGDGEVAALALALAISLEMSMMGTWYRIMDALVISLCFPSPPMPFPFAFAFALSPGF